MLRQKSVCIINWQLLLVGLIFIHAQCDARAVNVSNTWTMPQEGLNVFYRFFRDRISWFEADAVCQFHHANLVTVDNSFQFDATRDLLRELDVNDIVWIGLMRPQNSDRFMWSSNSRALVADTGYWAESLPLMDAPLCAVIDPIRDYRWHALRCGGPETASFLCEMPVPSWADACNLKDMPNLTLQYMADTASIELIRNCQEEGLLRTMCKGKQDRERALQDLICPRERLEAQRINDITNSHFKSLQIINSIPSDNNENNDIELLPMEVNYGSHYPEELQTEKNTVQRLIEQFNVDELMQADEPSNMESVSSFYKITGLIPKPVKKSAKKVLDYPKKDNGKEKGIPVNAQQTRKDKKRLPLEMEDMMMGDQPLQGELEMPEQFLNEEVSNEILEPLPHIKKTNIHKEDGLEKMEKEATAIKKSMEKSKEIENKKLLVMSTTTAQRTTTTTTASPIQTTTFTTEMLLTTTPAGSNKKLEDEMAKITADHTHTETGNNSGHLSTATTSSANAGHPMHPLQSRLNVGNEEGQHSHTRESADSSHFIPPMLMVKSHYVPPANKHAHTDHDHHQHYHQLQHGEQHLHLETSTDEPRNQSSDVQLLMAVTTPKALNMQPTTSKTLGTSLSSAETEQQFALNKQKHHEYQVTLTATEKDTSMKPITEQPQTTETELQKNAKNPHYEETQTTLTATTIQSVAITSAETGEKETVTSLPKDINKTNVGQLRDKDDTPQISEAAAETTQATKLGATTEKSFKSTQKPYDSETVAESTQKVREISDTTATLTTITTETSLPSQQHVPTVEETLTAIKNEKNKKYLQLTMATTEKQAAAQTAQVLTTSTIVSQPITQQTPTTIKPETHTDIITEKITAAQTLQQIEKDTNSKEQIEDDNNKEYQDKKETIVKRTETLQTSTALTQTKQPYKVVVDEEEEEEEEKEEEKEEGGQKEHTPATPTTTTTVSTPTTDIRITTTTTTKPITTTLPQNEIKTTVAYFFPTSPTPFASTANTPTTTTGEDNASTSSITQRTSAIITTKKSTRTTTTLAPTTTEMETATATTTARAETSTLTSATPEPTRNFLKVATEAPFKPNRRRSLTKPETVSYIKKILG